MVQEDALGIFYAGCLDAVNNNILEMAKILEQICVVTLDPIALDVADEFDILFVLSSDCPDGEDASLAAMSEDSPEPLATPEIDLGELVAQHLALALDPYPRRRGAVAEFDGEEAQNSELAPPADNPFAILGQLKHKM